MKQRGETASIIQVTRAGHHYTYSLTRHGETVAQNQRIRRERAMQIVSAHPTGKTEEGGRVDFSLDDICSWSWSVKVWETAV